MATLQDCALQSNLPDITSKYIPNYHFPNIYVILLCLKIAGIARWKNVSMVTMVSIICNLGDSLLYHSWNLTVFTQPIKVQPTTYSPPINHEDRPIKCINSRSYSLSNLPFLIMISPSNSMEVWLTCGRTEQIQLAALSELLNQDLNELRDSERALHSSDY